MSRPAVFLDFDNSITAEDTFVRTVRHFAPAASAAVFPEILAFRTTLRAGIPAILETIPAHRLPELAPFVAGTPLRPGLAELLDFLDARSMPTIVVSSGLELIVRQVLGGLANRFAAIHALGLEADGDRVRVVAPDAGPTEIVDKAAILARYPASESVAVGDSITDLGMARVADVVFARDHLATYMVAEGRSFHPWDDFTDVRRLLSERWGD